MIDQVNKSMWALGCSCILLYCKSYRFISGNSFYIYRPTHAYTHMEYAKHLDVAAIHIYTFIGYSYMCTCQSMMYNHVEFAISGILNVLQSAQHALLCACVTMICFQDFI